MVLNTTKQKTHYRIHLPIEVIHVLRWHVEDQLKADAQKDSELLFPALTGGFRSPSVLNKPFAEVSEEMGLGYAFTQRGMRRTFNDLARAADVRHLVSRECLDTIMEVHQVAHRAKYVARTWDLFGDSVLYRSGEGIGGVDTGS
jgi:hypothetical protein